MARLRGGRRTPHAAARDGDLLLHAASPGVRGAVTRCTSATSGGGQYVCNHLRSNEGSPSRQPIRAARVDAVVADAFLTALAPAELDALSRAGREALQNWRRLSRPPIPPISPPKQRVLLLGRQMAKRPIGLPEGIRSSSLRNVSTTMIQPGSKFKLGSSTLVDDLDEFPHSARHVLLAELETHQIQVTH